MTALALVLAAVVVMAAPGSPDRLRWLSERDRLPGAGQSRSPTATSTATSVATSAGAGSSSGSAGVGRPVAQAPRSGLVATLIQPRWPPVLLGCLGLAVGVVPALLLIIGLLRLRSGIVGRHQERLVLQRRRALVVGLAAVEDELQAGASFPVAFAAAAETAGPLRERFADAAARAEVGRDPGAAFTGEDRAEQVVGVALRVSLATGASASEVLAGLRRSLDGDAEVRRVAQEAVSGARASAALLAGLPLVGLVMGAGLGAHPVSLLLHTPAGTAMLASGVGLALAGSAWCRALAARVAR
ncbi:hypothetical protein M6D93_17925 [Jatrophihabitans telluris]|uniref:Type II secretion system protein GspF domain-containing protein n=1 Tax=Jatrophihabitans telluris TaxID=2038343 RepID=A0ABY4QXE1_9ACTN|nr:type II secretion system F family protein [Jatrophihabitans telluris]UQX88148.1 hypothetical protein M6D93_17925 [Jatrophihabitans telluris]